MVHPLRGFCSILLQLIRKPPSATGKGGGAALSEMPWCDGSGNACSQSGRQHCRCLGSFTPCRPTPGECRRPTAHIILGTRSFPTWEDHGAGDCGYGRSSRHGARHWARHWARHKSRVLITHACGRRKFRVVQFICFCFLYSKRVHLCICAHECECECIVRYICCCICCVHCKWGYRAPLGGVILCYYIHACACVVRVRGIRRVKVRTNPVHHVRTCMIVRVKLRVMRARRNGMHRKRMAQMRRTGDRWSASMGIVR